MSVGNSTGSEENPFTYSRGYQPVVRKAFGGKRNLAGCSWKKYQQWRIFLCSQFDTVISNLVSFATARFRKNYFSRLFFDP
jgi:hypothetical protein